MQRVHMVTLGCARNDRGESCCIIAHGHLKAKESLLAFPRPGPFCFGATPTLADICLMPQLANAHRFKADISKLKRVLEAEKACQGVKAFQDATPENVLYARERGLKVGAWTVNRRDDMERLRDLDAICTDRPDILAGLS